MRIQHNIMAMNAYRNYSNNTSALSKNLEKLSSGYKINRAGDDAAGLAISEKMRAQITGLEAAQKNAKDGISLVQTAEGALTEVHDMLNRMVYLATQSANGTYDSTQDRTQLQKEVDQLREEIDRIADSANFNGIKLLNGNMDGAAKMGDATNITVQAVADGKQGGADAQVGIYSFDLKDLKLYGTTKAATLSGLTIGGQSLISTAASFNFGTKTLGDKGYISGEDIVSMLKAGAGKTSVAIDGISYTIEYSGTKITLTGAKAPTTAASMNTAVTVSLKADTANSGSVNNGWDQAVHVDQKPQIAKPNALAQGKFTLTKAHIADGNQLTIGNTTYTFKVGKDSKVSGNNIIDLSKYESTDANLLTYAGDAISKLSNDQFDITTGRESAGTIYLTEKDGAVDYKKDWDLDAGGTKTDGKWNENVNGDDNSGVVRIAIAGAADATKGLTLQIGDTADDYNQLKVNIDDMHVESLGIDSISIADQASAAKAIDSIKAAINKVSDVRGTLGATQNRLDHTINNLSVMRENIQDAESTIRDTDIAEEMMSYTKNNILIQSAQAMLAQANQVPQGVLQLLQ